MTISRAVLILPVVAMLAIAMFEQFLELDPTNWSSNYLTAVSYLSQYHPGSDRPEDREYAEKGAAAFDKTLKLTAPSPEQWVQAENVYLSFLDGAGDRDRAIAYLEQQLAARPKDGSLINWIAGLYLKKGDMARAQGEGVGVRREERRGS